MSVSAQKELDSDSLEGQYAGFVTRLIAFIIDIVLINVSVLAVTGVTVLIFGFFQNVYALIPGGTDDRFVALGTWITGFVAITTMLIMVWIYPVVFWMVSGQTFGKRMMGLRVVRMNGDEMTFWRGIMRVSGYWVSALPLFFGFIWILFSNRRRGWHDIIAHTCVIYSWDARASVALENHIDRTHHTLRNTDN